MESSPFFSSFAVVGGTGVMGSTLVNDLAAQPGTTVVVLSRQALTKPFPANVTVKVVDYATHSSLVEALKGIQVVISTLGGPGLSSQPSVIKAAKEAGASLFVPSEYGMPTAGVTEGLISAKSAIHDVLKDVGLPYLLVYVGLFTDTTFTPFYGFDLANGKATIIGKGDTPIAFTASRDISSFLAHALTNFPAATLQNDFILRLQGDLKTFNDVIKLYEASHPSVGKVAVEYIDVATAERFVADNPGWAGFSEYLRLMAEKGHVQVTEGRDTSNALWTDWKPQSVEEYVSSL